MRYLTLFIFISICRINVHAEVLSEWLISKIQADEQLWIKAIDGVDGHSLELLESSKFYVPYFMELPPNADSSITSNDRTLFDNWKQQADEFLLPGGYIFRIRFKSAEPLYAMSAGFWSDNAWHSLNLSRDVTVEPENLWESSNGDYLYATLLGGVPPRLIVYDQNGEIARQESFDAFAADFEQRLQTAIAPYASSGKPVLEMISLAEYLRQPEAAWRVVDTTGQFNLRNQQQGTEEQDRLKQVGQLTRTTAVSGLTTRTATTPQTTRPPKPPPVVQPPALKQAPNAKLSPTPSDEATSSTSWSIIVVLIVAGIGLLWFFLKKAKVSRL